jgi:cytochrome c
MKICFLALLACAPHSPCNRPWRKTARRCSTASLASFSTLDTSWARLKDVAAKNAGVKDAATTLASHIKNGT